MPKDDASDVPTEVWREALDRLIEFRGAEPWKWIPDSAMTAHVDATGQPWFGCVLGNAKQVFGLCLYRGEAGFKFHRKLLEAGSELDPGAARFEHDAITAWYGAKKELIPEQRALFERLGFAPPRGQKLSWPDVRSHRPGYFPWWPDEEELRVLSDFIPRMLTFAALYRSHPECYESHGQWELPTLPEAGAARSIEDLEWRTWLNSPAQPIPPPVAVDPEDPLFRRVAALGQAEGEALEVDWFYSTEGMTDGTRPYYPRCLGVIREYGGYCFGVELLRPDEDSAAKAVPLILVAIEKLGARPARIVTSREELALRLQPLAERLGAETCVDEHMASFEDFRTSFVENFEGGGRGWRL
jgi:hypothetical protein